MLAKLLRRTTICSILSIEGIAFAQDPTATALFKAGKELEAKGNYKEACPKFEASYKREAALGTLMNMADCHEKTGVLARAWSEWGTAYEQARKENDQPRADLSKRRQDALEPRVPKMKVVVSGSAPDLAVWRDDRALDALEYGVDLPVEPGKHTITVRRGDKILTTEDDTAAESAHVVVNIDLAKVAADYPKPKEEPPPPPKPASQQGFPSPSKPTPWETTVGTYSVIGGGVVLAAGIVLEIAAIGLKGNPDCARDGAVSLCTQTGLDKIASARTAASAGMAMFVIGGLLVGTGITFWLIAPKQRVGVAAVPGGGVATWGMRF